MPTNRERASPKLPTTTMIPFAHPACILRTTSNHPAAFRSIVKYNQIYIYYYNTKGIVYRYSDVFAGTRRAGWWLTRAAVASLPALLASLLAHY